MKSVFCDSWDSSLAQCRRLPFLSSFLSPTKRTNAKNKGVDNDEFYRALRRGHCFAMLPRSATACFSPATDLPSAREATYTRKRLSQGFSLRRLAIRQLSRSPFRSCLIHGEKEEDQFLAALSIPSCGWLSCSFQLDLLRSDDAVLRPLRAHRRRLSKSERNLSTSGFFQPRIWTACVEPSSRSPAWS